MPRRARPAAAGAGSKLLRWQALGTRLLALLAVLVLLGGGVAWLIRGTGDTHWDHVLTWESSS